MTKIIEKHGSLFRLSDTAYRRLLKLVIAEQRYDLWELGRYIGCIHASMASFHRKDAEFELARQAVKHPSNSPVTAQPTPSSHGRRVAAGRSARGRLSRKQ